MLIGVCVTAHQLKPLTKDSPLLYDSLIYCSHFLKPVEETKVNFHEAKKWLKTQLIKCFSSIT